MRIYYNDYEETAKRWLRNYVEWSVFIENQKIILENLKAEISLDPVPKTTKFGFDAGGGGWEKPSQEEMYLERKEEREAKYKRDTEKVKTLEAKIEIMNNCLNSLSGTESQILKARFIHGKKWEAVSVEAGFNEKTCREKANRAISKMARMMFADAGPVQTTLRFYPTKLSVEHG